VLVSRHIAAAGVVAAAASGTGDADAVEKATEQADLQKLSVEEVLYLATRGGAETVGLGNKVGAFEVGMEWDAQLIGLGVVGEEGEDERDDGHGNVDVFGWESWPDRVAKWVYTGDDRNVKSVWVKGRLVHQRK
jgi:guanine deaminase